MPQIFLQKRQQFTLQQWIKLFITPFRNCSKNSNSSSSLKRIFRGLVFVDKHHNALGGGEEEKREGRGREEGEKREIRGREEGEKRERRGREEGGERERRGGEKRERRGREEEEERE